MWIYILCLTYFKIVFKNAKEIVHIKHIKKQWRARYIDFLSNHNSISKRGRTELTTKVKFIFTEKLLKLK